MGIELDICGICGESKEVSPNHESWWDTLDLKVTSQYKDYTYEAKITVCGPQCGSLAYTRLAREFHEKVSGRSFLRELTWS